MRSTAIGRVKRFCRARGFAAWSVGCVGSHGAVCWRGVQSIGRWDAGLACVECHDFRERFRMPLCFYKAPW